MRTCSKTQKYWIAHNLFNFDCNIGMLHLISIILMRGIQLKKNKELHILCWLWYNINCIFETLHRIHQKALQIQEKKQLCMKPPGFLVHCYIWYQLRDSSTYCLFSQKCEDALSPDGGECYCRQLPWWSSGYDIHLECDRLGFDPPMRH